MNGDAEIPMLPTSAVVETMRAFAVAGALASKKFWPKLQSLPSHARLWQAIENDADGVRTQLNEKAIFGGNSPSHFLPLPFAHPVHSDFIAAYFRPTFIDNVDCEIEVVIVCSSMNESIGLRFERAGTENTNTHSYAHVQLTRDFDRKPVKCYTNLCPFIPNSYPALPTRCNVAGDVWLAVLVCLFGLSKSDTAGLKSLLKKNVEITDNLDRPELLAALLNRAQHLFQS